MSIDQVLPPLLALPVELKLQIIWHIPRDEYPLLACLRRTHSSFLDLIPKAHIRSQLSETELCKQLIKTELEYAYLLPSGHYPCYVCAKILPLDSFVEYMQHSWSIDGTPKKWPRSCKDCCTFRKLCRNESAIRLRFWIKFTLEELPMPPARPRLCPLF